MARKTRLPAPFPALALAALLGIQTLIPGCLSQPLKFYPKHTLLFNIDGAPTQPTYKSAGKKDVQSSTYDDSYEVTNVTDGSMTIIDAGDYDAYLDGIFTNVENWEKHMARADAGAPRHAPKVAPMLAISIHGGLPDYNSTLQGEQQLIDTIRKDKDPVYVIGVNWSAGAKDALEDYWVRVTNGLRTNSPNAPGAVPLIPWITPVFKDICDLPINVALLPGSIWWHMNAVDNSIGVYSNLGGEGRAIRIADRKDFEELSGKNEFQNTRLIGQNFDTQGFFHQGWDWLMGLYTIPWEGIEIPLFRQAGEGAYYMMQRHIQRLFELDEGTDTDAFKYYGKSGKRNLTFYDLPGLGNGPMGVFLRRLGKFQRAHPEVRIGVFAHSMGTMVADEIIRRSMSVQDDEFSPVSVSVTGPARTGGSGPNLRAGIHFDRITYMAGADSVRNWQNSVWPYLIANDGSDGRSKAMFYNVTLNYLSEEREQTWLGPIPVLARGSLLVWIDNYLTIERDILDRTLGRYSNMSYYTQAIPKAIRDQIQFVTFGPGEHQYCLPDDPTVWSVPQTHGEAADVPYWKDSFYAAAPDKRDFFDIGKQDRKDVIFTCPDAGQSPAPH